MECDIITTDSGYVALAVSKKGIYAVSLPKTTAKDALAEIGVDFNPGKSSLFCKTAALLKRYYAGEKVDFSSLPLDLSWASPFAQRVYQELLKVPYGQTITYGELAARAGRPGAARAVGRSMATNKITVIIP
ncbi:methylated-DNA-protein-cysteine methyltransferase, selenocysteine-containing [Carboxydothermus pertinax]|uniref:Methylated-DNA-protein-cysteine methyltransferase, selenocysteine-containing n=2 Tax=Carboxydothermus pertinax TaxID=870242 RepID=A0A1L8CV45_9THEO|nr:methylated-DNA-protein-cysteine methyltransferase, selenocysteine-containing [Carboxydothermus pertinax]